MATIVRSTATTSWIDQRLFSATLPEVDHDSLRNYTNATSVERGLLVGSDAYRFANFLEASIEVSSSGGISGSRFTEASDMYRAPSFFGIESEPFDIRRSTAAGTGEVTFRQLVGCRTKSPETIGQGVGAAAGAVIAGPVGGVIGYIVGGEAAEEITAFPPIWTELTLTIRADGSTDSEVVRHSHFPSMCHFVQSPEGSETYHRESIYDARSRLEFWKRNGWGGYRRSTGYGNPWGIPDPSGLGDGRGDISDRDRHSSLGRGHRNGPVMGNYSIRASQTPGGGHARGPVGTA